MGTPTATPTRVSDSKFRPRSYNGNSASDGSHPTLFSLPTLAKPSDFLLLAKSASRDCDAVRRQLSSSLTENDDTIVDGVDARLRRARLTLRRLDDISNAVCGVIDAAELCRSVHASPEWRRCASDAFGMLSEYIGSLNADASLYRALVSHVFDGDGDGGDGGGGIMSLLTAEELRMADAMKREFERDGIHLKYTQREEARELNNVVVGLESLFTNNITEKTKYYNVEGEQLVSEVEKIVPRHVLGRFVRTTDGGSNSDDSNSIALSSDQLLTNTLLAHSPSPALRKEVYHQSHTAVPENLAVLDALIKHRHLHSTSLGYPSYAHRVLSDRMAGSPENVHEFLKGMNRRSEGLFRAEMGLIANAKEQIEGTIAKVEPWDVPFYTVLIKAQRQRRRIQESFADGGGSGDTEDEEAALFSGYFTVDNSIEGMKVLVQELFGIAMKEVNIPAEERWDVDGDGDLDGTGLRKFEFHHERDGPLGIMYFDLHPREGKFVHAAHFTIRCGRHDSDTDGRHQLPIVALVCNLSPPSSPRSALISHAEVETLFHEFGHGLHSLLSRTSFQHLSGTRAAMDFVETPSHLIETYARDPSFLSRILARHYVTGAPMSDRTALHLAQSRNDFRGIETRTQIVHSLFDQALFGPDPCSPSLGGKTSTEAFDALHRENGVAHAAAGTTHWHSRFGHLVTYGAGYYGYLYAQVFAADIWASCIASRGNGNDNDNGGGGGTTSREGGTKIWKEMLVHGGARDPNEMLRTVLGREPSVEAFFRNPA